MDYLNTKLGYLNTCLSGRQNSKEIIPAILQTNVVPKQGLVFCLFSERLLSASSDDYSVPVF